MEKEKILDKKITALLEKKLSRLNLISEIILLSLDLNLPVAIFEENKDLIARFYYKGKSIDYILIRKKDV